MSGGGRNAFTEWFKANPIGQLVEIEEGVPVEGNKMIIINEDIIGHRANSKVDGVVQHASGDYGKPDAFNRRNH